MTQQTMVRPSGRSDDNAVGQPSPGSISCGLSPCIPTGRGSGLKHRPVWVRIQPGAPNVGRRPQSGDPGHNTWLTHNFKIIFGGLSTVGWIARDASMFVRRDLPRVALGRRVSRRVITSRSPTRLAVAGPRDVSSMDILLVTATGVESKSVDELPALLKSGDGIVWVDIPSVDDEAEHILSDVFKFHPLAVKDAVRSEERRVGKEC